MLGTSSKVVLKVTSVVSPGQRVVSPYSPVEEEQVVGYWTLTPQHLHRDRVKTGQENSSAITHAVKSCFGSNKSCHIITTKTTNKPRKHETNKTTAKKTSSTTNKQKQGK